MAGMGRARRRGALSADREGWPDTNLFDDCDLGQVESYDHEAGASRAEATVALQLFRHRRLEQASGLHLHEANAILPRLLDESPGSSMIGAGSPIAAASLGRERLVPLPLADDADRMKDQRLRRI
jgi:hypothetical protein